MKTKHILIVLIGMLMPLAARAQQQPLTPEQEEQKMREGREQLVLHDEETLDLEVWQTFYVDSILVHNYTAMSEETKALAENRVENAELYQMISDKWENATYDAFRKILDDAQWKKYLKGGASRAKKSRDIRAAKRERRK